MERIYSIEELGIRTVVEWENDFPFPVDDYEEHILALMLAAEEGKVTAKLQELYRLYRIWYGYSEEGSWETVAAIWNFSGISSTPFPAFPNSKVLNQAA